MLAHFESVFRAPGDETAAENDDETGQYDDAADDNGASEVHNEDAEGSGDAELDNSAA